MGKNLLGLLVLATICLSYMEAEAAMCESRSKLFRGLCIRSDNCCAICEREGFLTGKCKGFRMRCICAKSCFGVHSNTMGGSDSPQDSGESSAPSDDISGGDVDATPDDAQAGVNFGNLGNNLPSAEEIVSVCNQYNLRRIRIFNPNPVILQALRGSAIEVTVGVANEDIPAIAQNPGAATAWVRNNIVNFRNVNFRYIAVGNEISPHDGATSRFCPFVSPAIENIHKAILAAGLGSKIRVSSALSMTILGQSYPPSAGAFRPDVGSFINPIINLLKQIGSPLLVNIYPYFAYIGDTEHIKLEYALFTSKGAVVIDGPHQYQNMFDAMLDAVYAALEKAGAPGIEVVVSETGWPTSGGVATSIDNARTYNNNLIQHVKRGTPRRPSRPIEAYVFDLFDENQKSPELEKHWGLFSPNKQQKYPFSFK